MSIFKEGTLSMGPGTFEVPLELFKLNRIRLADALKTHENVHNNSVIFLQGGDDISFYDTDTTYNNFRQESYFMWTFGVIEPGCYGVVEVATGKAHLFMPKFPNEYAIWLGPIHPLSHFQKKYGVEYVHYANEIEQVLKGINPSELLILKGVNSDSGLEFKEATFKGIDKFKVNNTVLYPVMANLRVYKTKYELDVLKYVTEVSSAAHRKVMRYVKEGVSEYQCESEFLHYCYSVGGCRHVSYTCICASQTNAAILHYGHAAAPNDRFLKSTDICLFDMGANYFGYAADITCSFPVSGKFSPDQKLIYEAVLAANLAVFKNAKPGVRWPDMHRLAIKTLLEELKKGGLLKGDVEEMIKSGLGAIFQPHGLGHLIGLDVHDVGGYLPNNPPRPNSIRGFDKLRTARVLEENMAVTIEPGCYFIDFLLDEALASPKLSQFLVADVIQRFRGFGGVRIEDDVVITNDGAINLTKVPRSVEEIENWMAGKDNDKY